MKVYTDYRDLPYTLVLNYAEKNSLNIDTRENYRQAAIALFTELTRPKGAKKAPKKTVSFKIDPSLIDALNKIRERGEKTAIVEAGIKSELVKNGYLTQTT